MLKEVWRYVHSFRPQRRNASGRRTDVQKYHINNRLSQRWRAIEMSPIKSSRNVKPGVSGITQKYGNLCKFLRVVDDWIADICWDTGYSNIINQSRKGGGKNNFYKFSCYSPSEPCCPARFYLSCRICVFCILLWANKWMKNEWMKFNIASIMCYCDK